MSAFPPPFRAAPTECSTGLNAPQRVDHPIGATHDPEASLTDPVVDEPVEKGKNIVGSKYFDSEGNPINRADIEADEDMKNDPVWISIRTGGTTRVILHGERVPLTAEEEELIKRMKVNVGGSVKANANAYELLHFPGRYTANRSRRNAGIDASDPSAGRKSEGKKRSWDDFQGGANKPVQDQDRRPNKRRHGNDGRHRRSNRNRHGNRGGGNRR